MNSAIGTRSTLIFHFVQAVSEDTTIFVVKQFRFHADLQLRFKLRCEVAVPAVAPPPAHLMEARRPDCRCLTTCSKILCYTAASPALPPRRKPSCKPMAREQIGLY